MKELNSGKFFQSAIMDETIRQMKETLPKMEELSSIRAKHNKLLYDAMIKEGFSKDQAFEYVKTRGI